jgi:hypothetical protein
MQGEDGKPAFSAGRAWMFKTPGLLWFGFRACILFF